MKRLRLVYISLVLLCAAGSPGFAQSTEKQIAREQADLQKKQAELDKRSAELQQREADLERARQELQNQQTWAAWTPRAASRSS